MVRLLFMLQERMSNKGSRLPVEAAAFLSFTRLNDCVIVQKQLLIFLVNFWILQKIGDYLIALSS